MKINVQESNECVEIEVSILCKRQDRQVKEILDFLQRDKSKINVQNEKNQKFLLPQEDIFYIESVDKKSFIYGKEDIYECDYRLYQLEERLLETHFFRISKSAIVNIFKVQSIEPEEGRRLKIVLENDERIIVSRQYVKEFKTKLGINRGVRK